MSPSLHYEATELVKRIKQSADVRQDAADMRVARLLEIIVSEIDLDLPEPEMDRWGDSR